MKRCSPILLFVCCLVVLAAQTAQARDNGRITRHDRNVIRFFLHHPKLAATPAGGKALAAVLPRVVRTLQAVEAEPTWPAHHQLWLCIHGGEAGSWYDQNTGGNGHWGGLQMHPGWGYGTSYHASDDSQLTQETAAEAGYRASGYSHSWLSGQWGATIGPCWQYA